MDKILQAGLKVGMSATSGIHSSKPNPAPREHDGANILPESFVPGPRDRVKYPTPTSGKPVNAPYICIGAWPWGDTATWHWSDSQFPAVQQAWKKLYDAGLNFIDTAEAYGGGKSEEIVGKLVAGLPRDTFVVQTKYLGLPLDPSNIVHPVTAPVKALKKSLERMKLDYVDIYLVHGPIHPQSRSAVAKGMAQCVEQGLARAIGIANHSQEGVLEFREELGKFGVPLALNQCEYSILRRYPEIHGEIQTCAAHGIVFQAYSSLGQGRLTGTYTPENPPPKEYKFSSYPMEEIQPTINALTRIASAHNKPVASVALNYVISKGATPLVGILNAEQADDAIQALGWRLTQDEIVEIDRVSIEGKATSLWQQG